jgi:hypothetical protein
MESPQFDPVMTVLRRLFRTFVNMAFGYTSPESYFSIEKRLSWTLHDFAYVSSITLVWISARLAGPAIDAAQCTLIILCAACEHRPPFSSYIESANRQTLHRMFLRFTILNIGMFVGVRYLPPQRKLGFESLLADLLAFGVCLRMLYAESIWNLERGRRGNDDVILQQRRRNAQQLRRIASSMSRSGTPLQ